MGDFKIEKIETMHRSAQKSNIFIKPIISPKLPEIDYGRRLRITGNQCSNVGSNTVNISDFPENENCYFLEYLSRYYLTP